MGLHYDLPVYKACYDLLLEIFQFTKDFSLEYKHTVGGSIKKEKELRWVTANIAHSRLAGILNMNRKGNIRNINNHSASGRLRAIFAKRYCDTKSYK